MKLQKVNLHNALNNPAVARDVPGYEGLYKITYNGMVYSYIKNKFLKPGLSGKNYLTVALWPKKTHYIHRMIAQAFLSNPDNKRTVNHKDGDKVFNHLSNLEWATSGENNQHAVDIGLRKIKCTPEMIAEVLRLHIKADKKFGAKALAEKFNVNKCTIHDIITFNQKRNDHVNITNSGCSQGTGKD